MKPTELAYFAGLLDGEGCIRIKRTKKYWGPKVATEGHQYTAAVYIANSCRAPLDELQATFGGRVESHTGTNKPMFRWAIGQAAAERFIRAVRPYQRIKTAQADNLLALRALQATSRAHRTKPVGTKRFPNRFIERTVTVYAHSDEYIAACEELHARAKALNAA